MGRSIVSSSLRTASILQRTMSTKLEADGERQGEDDNERRAKGTGLGVDGKW